MCLGYMCTDSLLVSDSNIMAHISPQKTYVVVRIDYQVHMRYGQGEVVARSSRLHCVMTFSFMGSLSRVKLGKKSMDLRT